MISKKLKSIYFDRKLLKRFLKIHFDRATHLIPTINSLFRSTPSTRSGILKAEAVEQFATALANAGIDDFRDINLVRLTETEEAVRKIPGQASGISFDYFRMLAGDDKVIKPDRMVQRFIAEALGIVPQNIKSNDARELLQNTSQLLTQRGEKWSPGSLDYSIWQAQRTKR